MAIAHVSTDSGLTGPRVNDMLGVCGSSRILAIHQARLTLFRPKRVTCFCNSRPDWLRRYSTLQDACRSSTVS
jgi:hypothetical protein